MSNYCEVVELYDSADVKTEVKGITCLIPVSEPHNSFKFIGSCSSLAESGLLSAAPPR